jgi:hypothetical protein
VQACSANLGTHHLRSPCAMYVLYCMNADLYGAATFCIRASNTMLQSAAAITSVFETRALAVTVV